LASIVDTPFFEISISETASQRQKPAPGRFVFYYIPAFGIVTAKEHRFLISDPEEI